MVSSTAKLLLSVLPAAMALAGAGLATRTFRGRRRARTIESVEEVDVGDLQPGDGPVAVAGEARPLGDESLPADLLGTDGLARVTAVEQYDERTCRAGGHTATRTAWKEVYDSSAAVPFAVDDGTGTVAVDVPDGGSITLETERHVVDTGEEPPPPVRDLVDAVPGLEPAPGERRRYAQGVVEPGERVVAVGEPVDDGGLVLGGDRYADAFVVSDADRERLAETESYGLAGYVLGGGLLAAGGLALVALWLR